MIGLVIQARNGSRRYPRKSIQTLSNRMVLEWVLRRAGKAQVDVKILATSLLEEDEIIERIALCMGWQVIRGHPHDVLSRYATAASKFGLSVVVRVTADCPLIDPNIINLACKKYLETGADYLCFEDIINGFNVEVIKAEWILKADQKAKLPSEREHV
ncbi:MAG: aminotransferase, partial [Aquificaceae bacterium]|nr:aminotransferase [Aquificaceae bacterium]